MEMHCVETNSVAICGLVLSPFVVIYGCRPVALASLLLLTAGMCLSAVAPNLPLLIIFYGAFGGAGWGGIYLVTSTIIQQTFSRHRGLATGIAALGFTTGTILSPILMDYLLRQYGLMGALLLMGGVYAQGLIFSMLLKSPKRLMMKTEQLEKGEQDEPETEKKGFVLLIKNMLDFTVFRKVTFVLAIVYYLCFWMGRYVILSQGVGAALHQGIPEKDAAYLLTVMGLSNLVVRLTSTFLLNCSWMNPLLFTAGGTLFMCFSGFIVTASKQYSTFVGAMVCLGFSEGVAVTVMPMVLVHILGVRRFARAWSILWVGLLPGTMAAGPLSGWLVDVTGDYSPAFILAGVLGGTASVVAVIIEIIIKCRRRQRAAACTDLPTLEKDVHVAQPLVEEKAPAAGSDPENVEVETKST